MEYLIGLIAVLVGLLFYSNTKRKSSEALLDNVETKEKLNKIDKEANKTEAQLAIEEAKRKQVDEMYNKEQQKKLTLKELEEFFTRNKDK